MARSKANWHKLKAQAVARFGEVDGRPTYEFVLFIYEQLRARSYRLPGKHRIEGLRPWQYLIIRQMVTQRRYSLQGCRQGTGKTFCVALVRTAEIVWALSCGAGMPTLKQGGRILAERISTYVGLLEADWGMRRVVDQSERIKWSNGAELVLLSTDAQSERSAQGYTLDSMDIDEAHEFMFEQLGDFTPLLKIAEKKRRDRLCLIGVGGPPQSSIETVKKLPGWVNDFYDDARLVEMDRAHRASLPAGHPELAEREWADIFEEERHLAPDKYDQFFRLRPVTAGTRRIFQGVRGLVLPIEPRPATYSVGIDVGRAPERDQTCIWLDEHRGEFTNTVRLELLPRGVPFPQQARMIAHLLYGCGLSELGIHGWELDSRALKLSAIAIEVNGLGIGLYDTLTAGDSPWLPGITPVSMSYERKHRAVAEWDAEMRRSPGQPGAKHGISDKIVLPGGQTLIDYLAGLTLEVKVSIKDGTTVVWEHSDVLSAGITCRAGRSLRTVTI